MALFRLFSILRLSISFSRKFVDESDNEFYMVQKLWFLTLELVSRQTQTGLNKVLALILVNF